LGVAVWLGSGDVSAWLSPLLARRSARLARCCSAALFLSEAIGVDEATGRDVATFEGERVAVAAGSWAAAVGEISGRLGFLPRCSCIFCWRSAWTLRLLVPFLLLLVRRTGGVSDASGQLALAKRRFPPDWVVSVPLQ
jgi:hypothetical protein